MGNLRKTLFLLIICLLLPIPGKAEETDGNLLLTQKEQTGPREISYTLFARLPLLEKISLSPNGEFFAALYPQYGEALFTIFDIRKNPEVDPLPIQYSNQNINYIGWANNDRLLIGRKGFSFVLNGVLFALGGGLSAFDKDGTNHKKLVGNRSPNNKYFYFRVLNTLQGDEKHILIELWKFGEEGSAVYKMDVYTGDLEEVVPVTKNIFTWLADYDGNVRLGIGEKRKKPIIIVRRNVHEKWVEIQDEEIFDDGEFELIGFGFDPSILYFLSSLNTGRKAVYEYDLNSRTITRKVFDNPVYDVTGLVLNLKTRTIDAGFYTGDFPEYVPLNEEFEKWQTKIQNALGGLRFQIIDASMDENFVIIRSFSERDPGSLYFFDGINNELSPIWEVMTSLFPENMNPVQKVVYYARDGLELEGYLTIPKGMDKKNLPTVILPHGGPWIRDNMVFDVQAQFLANRGFAVFQMNFRGSSGYGTKFLEMGYGEWGKKMQTDIQDGLYWLIENGITDPEKVCILGGSYGGYATLMALAQYPEVYKCGIALAPVTDLNLLLKEQRGGFSEKLVKKAIKDEMSKKDLSRLSPAKLADQIEDPVLLVHGTYDAMVPLEHSEKMEKALKKNGKEVKLVKLEKGGHEMYNEEHRFLYFREIEDFLKKHLLDFEVEK